MKTLKELIQQEQEKHNPNKFTALNELITEVATTTAKAVGELVRTHTEKNGGYCDTGEDMDWACRSDCVRLARERLKTFLGEV